MQKLGTFTDFVNEAAKYQDDSSVVRLANIGFSLRDQIHIFHWQSEVGDAHKALGDFYDGFLGSFDNLMEVIQGRYGRFSVKGIGNLMPLQDLKDIDIEEYFTGMVNNFNDYKKKYESDSDIVNIIDEITASMEKTKYLLTMS